MITEKKGETTGETRLAVKKQHKIKIENIKTANEGEVIDTGAQ